MSFPRLRDLKTRDEFKSARYVFRYLRFFALSFSRQKISADIWGSRYRLSSNRHTLGIDGKLYVFRDEYEPEVRETLLEHFTDGALFVDIGANSGYWSRFIASRFKNSRIVAFEPSKYTFKRLSENMVDFSDRVRLKNAAVSDVEQSSYLTHAQDPGSNYLNSAPPLGEAEPVHTITLDHETSRDEWLRGHVQDCLVKIDVEGHELQALRGARHFIRTHRPIIVFEMMKDYLTRAQATTDDILRYLAELDYRVFSLGEDERAEHRREIASECDILPNQSNFLGIHKGKRRG